MLGTLDTLAQQATGWTVGIAAAIVVALVVTGVLWRRTRRRRRRQLFQATVDQLEPLLTTTVTGRHAEPMPPRPDDHERADAVRDAGSGSRAALSELERISRFETAAAASALRQHVDELARVLEARLRGEGDPYLLDVHITELRERVRADRQRLDAATGP